MNNANPATPAADQEIDARLAVVQEAVSALANPIPILEDIEAELDLLADEEADPEAINAIHHNAITLLDSQQRLVTAFMTTPELAQALKGQRETARKGLMDLKQALENVDTDVQEVQDLWTSVEEMINEDNESYPYDVMHENVVDQIAQGSGLGYVEAVTLLNLLTDGELSEALCEELSGWIRRASEFIPADYS